jgi:hypothetical protein
MEWFATSQYYCQATENLDKSKNHVFLSTKDQRKQNSGGKRMFRAGLHRYSSLGHLEILGPGWSLRCGLGPERAARSD